MPSSGHRRGRGPNLPVVRTPAAWAGRAYSSAADIPVDALDLVLLWPVLVEDSARERIGAAGAEKPASELLDLRTKEIVDASNGAWAPLGTYPAAGDDAGVQYAEWVYHHPFVRSAVYPSLLDVRAHTGRPGQVVNRNMRVLGRGDLESVEVTVRPDKEPVTVRLRETDTKLYLFDSGVALLVVGLRGDGEDAGYVRPDGTLGPLDLATVLNVQDPLRRCYAPFWSTSKPKDGRARHAAGVSPERLMFHFAGGKAVPSHFGTFPLVEVDAPDAPGPDKPKRLVPADPKGDGDEIKAPARHRAHVDEHREPYTVEGWRELMRPLTPVGADTPAGCRLRFKHVGDERLVLLSYLAVPDPRAIGPADWLRIATVETAGDKGQYPYSPAFVGGPAGRLENFAYDRFWDPTGDPPAQGWFDTRWLCCGFAFAAVGSSGSPFFLGSARDHFRHHYFVMALIAQFHRASLLSFKTQLADAVEALRSGEDRAKAEADFRTELMRIEKDLLAFRVVYWVTEVSNQVQGKELFDLWSRHLGTRELFQQVFDEAREATGIVASWAQRRREEQADRQAVQSGRLAVIAASFLVIPPLLATIDNARFPSFFGRLAATTAFAFAALLLVIAFPKRLGGAFDWIGGRHEDPGRAERRAWLMFAAVVALVAGGWTVLILLLNSPTPPGGGAPAPAAPAAVTAPTAGGTP